MAHPVVHWEIGGRDVAALREFYGKVFSWTITDASPAYCLVQPGDGGFGGGLMQTSDRMPRGAPKPGRQLTRRQRYPGPMTGWRQDRCPTHRCAAGETLDG